MMSVIISYQGSESMKKYSSNAIYFGKIIYNTDDGYYYNSNHTYEKINKNTYRLIGKEYCCKTFKKKTEELITCSDLFPLSALLDGEIKMLTTPMLELYKLKYMILKEYGKLPKEVVIAPYEEGIKLDKIF